VLDDLHLVHNRAIHEGLTFLLAHQPPTLHLVIATRADPPLPLARLRGRRELTELRAKDLRFTQDETDAFFRQMSLQLSHEDLDALEHRTEGWITGLQLAALSRRDQEDAAGFIADFTGSHRYVLDYLTEEVLRWQPPALRAFLLQTSVLDRMTAPLCVALLGPESTPSAQVTLERLEAQNLFVVPLDEQRL
jgi:LuxR family maltose regulon positive regulatory protein